MKYQLSKTTIRRLLMSLILFTCLMIISDVKPTMAATKSYMKNLKGISWDLKPDKKITFQTMFAGVGMHNQKARITNWEITDSEEPGFKKLTFTLTMDHRWSVSKSQVHAIANSSPALTSGLFSRLGGYCIVDYYTGDNLEAANNNYGVVVTPTDFIESKRKTYKDQHGCFVRLFVTTTTATVIYPDNYTGLTIGVTGSKKVKETAGDEQFYAGIKPFGVTSYYDKNNKKIAHFMRVTS